MKTLFALLAALLSLAVHAEPLMIAAAADLAYCMDDLTAAFRAQAPGAEVKVSAGASGTLFAQVKNGAPFDVFMSADMSYAARLAQEGGADPASLFHYATGRLAVWTLDPAADLKAGLPALAERRFARIAIANPDVAPYGRAARLALERAGLWARLQPRLVIGENITQTAQFVQTGNAQAGLVSLSSLMAPKLKGQGSYALVAGAEIEQGAVVTRHGQANPLAAQWMRFLRSPAARAVFARFGFAAP
ncbi:MAG: molybdate ABC transporter substrate-binding protein [Telluria sp.]